MRSRARERRALQFSVPTVYPETSGACTHLGGHETKHDRRATPWIGELCGPLLLKRFLSARGVENYHVGGAFTGADH